MDFNADILSSSSLNPEGLGFGSLSLVSNSHESSELQTATSTSITVDCAGVRYYESEMHSPRSEEDANPNVIKILAISIEDTELISSLRAYFAASKAMMDLRIEAAKDPKTPLNGLLCTLFSQMSQNLQDVLYKEISQRWKAEEWCRTRTFHHGDFSPWC